MPPGHHHAPGRRSRTIPAGSPPPGRPDRRAECPCSAQPAGERRTRPRTSPQVEGLPGAVPLGPQQADRRRTAPPGRQDLEKGFGMLSRGRSRCGDDRTDMASCPVVASACRLPPATAGLGAAPLSPRLPRGPACAPALSCSFLAILCPLISLGDFRRIRMPISPLHGLRSRSPLARRRHPAAHSPTPTDGGEPRSRVGALPGWNLNDLYPGPQRGSCSRSGARPAQGASFRDRLRGPVAGLSGAGWASRSSVTRRSSEVLGRP